MPLLHSRRHVEVKEHSDERLVEAAWVESGGQWSAGVIGAGATDVNLFGGAAGQPCGAGGDTGDGVCDDHQRWRGDSYRMWDRAAGRGSRRDLCYRVTDPTNQRAELRAYKNVPVDIGAGQAQSFLIALTPQAEFAAQDIPLKFSCTNAADAPVYSGLNSLLLSSTSRPGPDIVALAADGRTSGGRHRRRARIDGDGVLRSRHCERWSGGNDFG
ncbi:MAG: hypothetical protein U5L03_16255 [Burkholderiaceae bacterium]|nr:hypothetical protein [Burkholderiaceae bacterium]